MVRNMIKYHALKKQYHVNLSVKMIKNWSPDAIVHCAFETNFQNTKKSYSTNIVGSKTVIKLARETNSYFLFISSMSSHKQALSTYGKHKLLVEKELDLSMDGIISPGLIIGEGGIFLQTIKIIKAPRISSNSGSCMIIHSLHSNRIISEAKFS